MTTTYRSTRDIPEQEYLSAGTALCAGCGGLECIRLFHKVLGKDVVFVNAAGCMTLLTTYPMTPFQGSWLYTTMGSAAAGAQGVRDALDVLIERGRMSSKEDLKVVVLAGDGSSADIGLTATSGAMHRNLDFYYLCYDNEGYGNTGFQMSSTSPFGSHTHTTDPVASHPAGTEQNKKDLFEIWRAQKPPYLATVSPRHPVDMARKIEKSMATDGPRMFLALSPCPPGWGYEPGQTHEIARGAVETGIWPLKEAIRGMVYHTHTPKMDPVATYLEMQDRYRHLFEPKRQEAAISQIQEKVNEYWASQNVRFRDA
ncbi:MAG: pyruvate synthase [Candidatus Latescibacteria bacterium]|nr:pyruvate synthase [Candidatus Latescibacterota bacterium]